MGVGEKGVTDRCDLSYSKSGTRKETMDASFPRHGPLKTGMGLSARSGTKAPKLM